MRKLIISIIIGLAVLGSVFLLYRRVRQTPAANSENQGQGASSPEAGRQAGATATDRTFSAAVQKISETDKDLDGLTDAEEKKNGTDPTKADTDGDGILDKDEITIYHTDPLKADTDGDGMKDGDEVRRGRNPNGPGKFSL